MGTRPIPDCDLLPPTQSCLIIDGPWPNPSSQESHER